ncbi:type IV toxin-antitoxin system AbiEi family antitoxin domain-containing protein, partial [Microbacterium sp.]|uniref:type IV toxin-antitoxin system AbiEi family antitoxin domain-containing protein n=2 Tax=Microbacterium sp. TaxID=51671 RepID=UPI003C772547
MSVSALAAAFTLADARAAGLNKDQVYGLLERGEIERAGRGVFVRPQAIAPDFTALAAATVTHEDATLCLMSALVYHDLSDAIPFASDIALPRGTRHPAGLAHVNWHSFDPTTFQIGREHADIGGRLSAAIYSAERTIVDCFRL